MTEQKMCEKHPEEMLKPCHYCKKDVCGICETYVNPVTDVAISKEVWEEYPKTVKLVDTEWPKEAWVSHLNCSPSLPRVGESKK